MTTATDQSTPIMRHLINSCYRAEVSFRSAAEGADGPLKHLLELYAQQRTRFAAELREYAPFEVDGNETRAANHDRAEDPCASDVSKCVETDARTISLYKKALADRALPTRAHFLVSAQLALMQRGHDRVCTMLQESPARAHAPHRMEAVSA
jgi:hypothetical protein